MSEIDELTKAIDEAELLQRKIQELKAKKLELDERRVSLELQKLHDNDNDLRITKESNFGLMSEDQINKLILANDEYIEAAKTRTRFIDVVFDDIVPFFRKNIILICGSTGAGKSTTVSNVIRTTIAQKNANGNFKKVLVITNEQNAEDFYNSVTCSIKGWPYTNHDLFTQEQRDTFKQYIKFFASSGLVTVIDDNYNGSRGVTKSIEGIKTIFDNLIANGQHYDAIIIDYYQNIKDSKIDPRIKDWEVQQKLAAMLDTYKNIYPAPIVVTAQIQPNREEENVPFQFRMKGAKSIGDVATLILEVIPERDQFRTAWKVHKSRFTKGVSETFYTGYQNNSFVTYDDAYRQKVQPLIDRRQGELIDKAAGLSMNNKVEEKE